MRIVNLQCPNCGARLSIEDGMYVCNSCGTTTAIDYDESDVEFERLRTEAERDERQHAHERELLERSFELQERAQIESERRQNQRDRQAARELAVKLWIKRIVALLVMVGVCYGGYLFFVFFKNQSGGASSSSRRAGAIATPTPAPNYTVTPEDLKNDLDDFISSGKAVQMKIDECAIMNENGVVHSYSKTDATFLDAYLVSGIPDKSEKQSCRLVLIYEVTWQNDDYGEQTCYDAVYFEGIRVNPNGGIISDYNGRTIFRSDAAWGWAMAYSFEEYSQCYLENVKALGGTVTEVVINSSFTTEAIETDVTESENANLIDED